MPEHNKNEIVLRDWSTNRSTQVFGPNVVPFNERNPIRRIVIDEEVNLELGFGGEGSRDFLFEIRWHWSRKSDIALVAMEGRKDHPRHNRTKELPSKAQSQPAQLTHGPSFSSKIRHLRRVKLGEGGFGEVWKVVNVDSGEYLALKCAAKTGSRADQLKNLRMMKREGKILSTLSYRNIIQLKEEQTGKHRHDILLEFKDGTVENLIDAHVFEKTPKVCDRLLKEMLHALEYLDSKGIIHRDVKPANILYTRLPDGTYHFKLADFGAATKVADPKSKIGTPRFMAPEVRNLWSTAPQTPKADVWSLFVTIAYTINPAGFRDKLRKGPIDQVIQEVTMDTEFRKMKEMVTIDPRWRASAAQMLAKLYYADKGRTTGRERIQTTG
ncbi:hypothetical protein ACJ41O_010198 [Fusarium nematophilum]